MCNRFHQVNSFENSRSHTPEKAKSLRTLEKEKGIDSPPGASRRQGHNVALVFALETRADF